MLVNQEIDPTIKEPSKQSSLIQYNLAGECHSERMKETRGNFTYALGKTQGEKNILIVCVFFLNSENNTTL